MVKKVDDNDRNSSIEVLKILAMIIIIFSHCVPYGIFNGYNSWRDLAIADSSLNLLFVYFRYLGAIGNAIFIICSAYYLCDKDKISIYKILKIIVNVFLIQLIVTIIYLIFGDGTLDLGFIIKQIFSITFNQNWFITCSIYLKNRICNTF